MGRNARRITGSIAHFHPLVFPHKIPKLPKIPRKIKKDAVRAARNIFALIQKAFTSGANTHKNPGVKNMKKSTYGRSPFTSSPAQWR